MKDLPVLIGQDEIKSIIRDCVRDELSDLLPRLVKQATEKPYLTSKEVRELTGFSPRKLHYLRSEGKLPYIQHGNSILYPTGSVFKFLEDHRVRGGE